MDNKTQYGMGFIGWLTILFIGLKLTGYITWSWIWILSPVWGPFAFFMVIFFILALIAPKHK